MIDWKNLAPLPLRRQRDRNDRERLAAVSLAKKRAKHKGRNHWRNWERRQMEREKKAAAKIQADKRHADARRHHAAVRAFWEGLRPDHP